MEKKELKKYLKNDSIIFVNCNDTSNFKQKESPDYFTIRGGFDPRILIIKNITFTDEDGTIYKNCIQVVNTKNINILNKAFKYAEYKNIDKFYYVSRKNKALYTIKTKSQMFTKKTPLKFKGETLDIKDGSSFNYLRADLVGHISFVALGAALSGEKEFNDIMFH